MPQGTLMCRRQRRTVQHLQRTIPVKNNYHKSTMLSGELTLTVWRYGAMSQMGELVRGCQKSLMLVLVDVADDELGRRSDHGTATCGFTMAAAQLELLYPSLTYTPSAV